MLDKYTKDMLWTNIYNEYSDSEQLDIIEYLVELLKANQDIYMQENSIEEVYSKGLQKILEDIKELKVKEHEFLLDNKESDLK